MRLAVLSTVALDTDLQFGPDTSELTPLAARTGHSRRAVLAGRDSVPLYSRLRGPEGASESGCRRRSQLGLGRVEVKTRWVAPSRILQ